MSPSIAPSTDGTEACCCAISSGAKLTELGTGFSRALSAGSGGGVSSSTTFKIENII